MSLKLKLFRNQYSLIWMLVRQCSSREERLEISESATHIGCKNCGFLVKPGTTRCSSFLALSFKLFASYNFSLNTANFISTLAQTVCIFYLNLYSIFHFSLLKTYHQPCFYGYKLLRKLSLCHTLRKYSSGMPKALFGHRL